MLSSSSSHTRLTSPSSLPISPGHSGASNYFDGALQRRQSEPVVIAPARQGAGRAGSMPGSTNLFTISPRNEGDMTDSTDSDDLGAWRRR